MENANNMKEWAEALSSLGTAIFKYAGSSGVLVVFIYCAFVIHYFPTGVSIGDSVLFLFAALGFGSFYLVCLGLGVAGCGPLLLLSPTLRKSADWFLIGLLIMLAFGALAFSIVLSVATKQWEAIAAIYAGGLGIVVTWAAPAGGRLPWPKLGAHSELGEDPAPLLNPCEECAGSATAGDRGGWKLVAIGVSALIPLITAGKLDQNLSKQTFAYFGLRAEQASLLVDDDNYKAIQSAAAQLGVPVLGCGIEGTSQVMVHNMRVLWHGIGERSLVEFILPDSDGSPHGLARFELKRDGVRVLTPSEEPERVKRGAVEACLTLQTDTYFDSYADTQNALGQHQLQVLRKQWEGYLKEGHLKVVGATIEGYTDRIPVNRAKDSNQLLSERRANAVRDALKELWSGLADSEVDAIGWGAARPKSNCPETLQGVRLTECLADDRRVVIKLRLALPKLDSGSQRSSPSAGRA